MRNSDRNTRRGFTLSEMLVVLGILVVITALAQPALRGALGDSRLRSAAKQVRAELAKARLKAMQSGVAQRFRYQLGKSHFEIAPDSQGADADQTASGRSRQERQREVKAVGPHRDDLARRDSSAGPDGLGQKLVEQNLPEGVRFDDAEGEPRPGDLGDEEGWSSPIVFYPNGRTENAHIRLKGEHQTVVDVSLRGLTGVATASRPRHEEGKLR